MTRTTVAVPLAGELADALAIYCKRSLYNRVNVIRSLLAVVFTEPDEAHAMATIQAWRKDVKDKLKCG